MSIEINTYSLVGSRRENQIRLYERKPEPPPRPARRTGTSIRRPVRYAAYPDAATFL